MASRDRSAPCQCPRRRASARSRRRRTPAPLSRICGRDCEGAPTRRRIVSVQSPQSMEGRMRRDTRRPGSDDIFVGIDVATRQHQVVVLDAGGRRLTSFQVPHSKAGLTELVQRCTSPRMLRRRARVQFAFEATGHVWEAVSAFLEARALSYSVVNPLATFRVREARHMSRDKRDLTDAEEIAQLLRSGIVTQCQLPLVDDRQALARLPVGAGIEHEVVRPHVVLCGRRPRSTGILRWGSWSVTTHWRRACRAISEGSSTVAS